MKWIALVLLVLNLSYCTWQTLGINHAKAEDRASLWRPAGDQLLLWEEWGGDEVLQEAGSASPPEAEPEPPPVATAAVAAPDVVDPEPAADEPQPQACYTLGPFYLVHDVSRVAEVFETRGVTTRQRAAAERKQGGFWVFIPPRPTLRNAREVLRQLQGNGIHDPLIITEGRRANAISVGVYSSQVNAEERHDAILQLGYTAEIEPLQHTQPVYWLDVELRTQSEIPRGLWRIVADDFPNLTQKNIECDQT